MYPGKWAKKFPEKAAAINSVTGDTLTYFELNRKSNQLAQLLSSAGLKAGDHIAVFMENNLKFFEIVWAALRSGLYITTINRYLTSEEAAYILDNCEAKALISSAYLEDVAGQLPSYPSDCNIWLMTDGTTGHFQSYEKAIAEYSDTALEDEPAGQFMLYSSGTTGRPKGILRPPLENKVYEDAGAVGRLQRQLWDFTEDTVYLSPAPLYHSAPAAFTTATQALGGTVIMMPRFDELGSLDAIEKYKVTHSQWVPTMFTRMLKLPDTDREQFDLSSHRFAIHAAAPCPAGIKHKMFDWWGPIIYEYYGGTELNGIVHASPTEWLSHVGTVGRPVIGIPHICDDEGHELPNGVTGIVYFELPEMPFEYFKETKKTKNAQHPLNSNWSKLGDVGYLDDDGFLYLTDRESFMIISGGVNIYPQEIEDALIMHEKIADVAVVGVPNEEMGEEVKAVVELIKGIDQDEEIKRELMKYSKENIAHYKCPKSIDFVSELPRLPTGKLYKRLIKDAYCGKTGSKIV